MRIRTLSKAVLATAVASCAFPLQAGNNAWTETGPNAANVRVEFASKPSSAVAYARGGDKFWRSSDGGITWTQKLSGNTDEYAFTVDPNDGNVVIAETGSYQMMRSTDGADTFSGLGATFSARNFVFGGAGNSTLFAIAYNSPYLRKSTDRGTSWTSGADTGLPPYPVNGGFVPQPLEIAIGGANADIIYFGLHHSDYQGIYKSVDGGMNWTAGQGLQGVFVNGIATTPGSPTASFVATDNGLYFSADAISWARVPDPSGTGVATLPISTVTFDRFNPQVLYAGGQDHGEIFRSADFGLTWERRDQGIVASRINSISTRDATGTEIIAGTSHTVYRSTNTGQSWAVSASGIRSASVTALQNGSKLRAGLTDGGIYESADGNTWTPVNNAALRASLRDQKFAPVISISEPGKLFAIFEASGDLAVSDDGGNGWQRPPTFNYLHNGSSGGFLTELGSGPVHYATSYSGVDKSYDDGLTWSTVNVGLPSPPLVTKIVKNADATLLFAGTFNQGMYKSVNRGLSWAPINNGLTAPNSLVIRRLVYDEANDVLVVGSNDGLYISRDAGASYTPLASPVPGTQVSTGALLVEDFDHGAIYFGTVGRVFRSVDKGATWTELSAGAVVNTPFTSVNDLVGDGPGVLYAGFTYAGLQAFTVAPDLRLTATTVPQAGVRAVGASFPLAFRVTNDGPFASTFSSLKWNLPSNVALTNLVTTRGSCTASTASRVLACDLGVLQPAQTADISMTVTGTAGGTVNITANAAAAEIDPQPSNNSFSNSGVRFEEQVDLSVSLTASAASVDTGATVEYTLTVHNDGPDTVTGATLTTSFDARDQYSMVQGTSDSCIGPLGGVITCPLQPLAAGASRSWHWAAQANVPGPRTSSAQVSVDPDKSHDASATNNLATASVTVVPVNDLEVNLVGVSSVVLRGASAAYTLRVVNHGVVPAPGVVSHLTLPAGLQFASSTGACTAAAAVITCDLGTIAAGAEASVSVTLNATAAASVSVGADVAGGNPDRNLANNTASAALTISPVADLAASLASSVSSVQTSTAFTYTLTVSNAANADTANATAKVTLSSLLSYTSATGATCTVSGAVVSCDLGAIAAGASKAVTLNVSGSTAGSASSSAEVTSSIVDSNLTNNSVSATAVTLTSPPPPPPPQTPPTTPTQPAKGGGGALDPLTALLLAGALGVYARRRRTNPPA